MIPSMYADSKDGKREGWCYMKTAVVAIGGNAIIQEGQKGTLKEQMENISKCCAPIIDLIEAVSKK